MDCRWPSWVWESPLSGLGWLCGLCPISPVPAGGTRLKCMTQGKLPKLNPDRWWRETAKWVPFLPERQCYPRGLCHPSETRGEGSEISEHGPYGVQWLCRETRNCSTTLQLLGPHLILRCSVPPSFCTDKCYLQNEAWVPPLVTTRVLPTSPHPGSCPYGFLTMARLHCACCPALSLMYLESRVLNDAVNRLLAGTRAWGLFTAYVCFSTSLGAKWTLT